MTRQAQKQEAAKDAKAPTHTLFHIEDRGADNKGFWTEIAVGWETRDGSVNLRSSAGAVLLPGHDYQLRIRKERSDVGSGK